MTTPAPSEVAETTAGEREVPRPVLDVAPCGCRHPKIAGCDHEPDAGEVDTALIVTSLVVGHVSGAEAIAALDRQIAAHDDRVRREEGERIAQAIEAEAAEGLRLHPQLRRAARIARAASVGRGEGL